MRNAGKLGEPAAAPAGGVGPAARGGRPNYLRVYMGADPARKLEPEPAVPRYFITESGMGYRFEPEDEPVDD